MLAPVCLGCIGKNACYGAVVAGKKRQPLVLKCAAKPLGGKRLHPFGNVGHARAARRQHAVGLDGGASAVKSSAGKAAEGCKSRVVFKLPATLPLAAAGAEFVAHLVSHAAQLGFAGTPAALRKLRKSSRKLAESVGKLTHALARVAKRGHFFGCVGPLGTTAAAVCLGKRIDGAKDSHAGQRGGQRGENAVKTARKQSHKRDYECSERGTADRRNSEHCPCRGSRSRISGRPEPTERRAGDEPAHSRAPKVAPPCRDKYKKCRRRVTGRKSRHGVAAQREHRAEKECRKSCVISQSRRTERRRDSRRTALGAFAFPFPFSGNGRELCRSVGIEIAAPEDRLEYPRSRGRKQH